MGATLARKHFPFISEQLSQGEKLSFWNNISTSTAAPARRFRRAKAQYVFSLLEESFLVHDWQELRRLQAEGQDCYSCGIPPPLYTPTPPTPFPSTISPISGELFPQKIGLPSLHFIANGKGWCRLRAAGAVLIAKLATGEMAYDDVWWGGRVKNPWNIAEGSSGSSAGVPTPLSPPCSSKAAIEDVSWAAMQRNPGPLILALSASPPPPNFPIFYLSNYLVYSH